MRCAAITRAGERCRLDATHASYCYQHSPQTAEQRRRNARRGGRAGGNGRSGTSELVAIKSELRGVIADVRGGTLARGVGAVVFQGYNALLKVLETERKIKETEELEERLEALERAAGMGGGRRYG